MNILVVCSMAEELNTSSMLCMELICKGFLELGHKVALVTPQPDENSRYFNKNHSFDYDNLIHLRFGNRVKKVETSSQSVKSLASFVKNAVLKVYRAFDLFGRSIETLKYTDEIKSKIKESGFVPDVIFSASDPKVSHILAGKLLDIFPQKPYFLQYWGDPLTLDIARKTLTPKFVRKAIENSILKKADKVVYVSHLTLDEQKEFFPKLAYKMTYQPTPCEAHIYNQSDEKYIGYFGSYNSSVRNIKPLYEAFNKNKNFKLIIIGDSDVKLEPTEYVEIIDRIPAEELGKYYDTCGIIANLTNDFGSQIPAKIFRDAGTNKEVLLLFNEKNGNSVKDYFSKYERYTLCPNSVDSISEALEDYDKNGIPKTAPLKAFDYVTVAEAVLDKI